MEGRKNGSEADALPNPLGFSKGSTIVVSTLASDMARSGVRSFVDRVESTPDLTEEEVRDLLASCEIPVMLLAHSAGRFSQAVDRGIELSRFQELISDLPDLVNECIRAFARLRIRADALKLDAAGVATLGNSEKMLRQVSGDLSKLVSIPSATGGKIDPSSLPADRGNRESSEYVRLDDFAQRLRTQKAP